MRKIISITILSILVLFGSGFKAGAPDLMPAPLPAYTMVDITDLDDFIVYYGSIYAIKVKCFGLLYEDQATPLSDEYIVNDPDDTSIWNMSHKYYCTINSSDVLAYVYIKWTSQSSWSFLGSISTWQTGYVTSTIYNHFLSLMSFSIFDLPAPAPMP
jgi:hypothetical protein